MSPELDRTYFKTDKEHREFPLIEFRLQFIVMALAGYMAMVFGRKILITDTLRDDPNSVHGYGRGCDVRCNNWTNEEMLAAEKFLNIIQYNNKKNTLLIHGDGMNIHLHIQIYWKTQGINFKDEG